MKTRSWTKRGLTAKASSQRGMSLIELMISLVLGLLVTAAVYQIYSANQRSSRMQDALSQVQENGRFALETLGRDARQSGYRGGCANDSPLTNHLDSSAAGYEAELFELQAGLKGWDDSGGTYESDLKNYVTGTDVVLIKHFATPAGTTLNGLPGINSDTITVDDTSGVPKGAILVVADALGCDVFQNTDKADTTHFDRSANAGVSPGNQASASSPLSKSYDANAQIMRFESSLYYLGKSTADDGANALRRRSYSNGAIAQDEELITGIVDMQIRYGVDTSGDGQVNSYVPADSGHIDPDWRNVLAISFHLLLRDEAPNILLLPASLSFANGTFNAASNDLRLYQAFTTTVGIRNRLR
ncbi:PilW family protein [Pistricoccus aurantiacus]|uniref:PilW family protein n=1 Tax=Pistricoccus aurantiacus TaxID=1883414 RepID=UPI0036413EA7